MRVAEVVISSVSTDTLLAGKVLGVGAASLTQIVIWAFTSMLVYRGRGMILARFGIGNVPIPIPHIGVGVAVLLLAFFVLGFTFYAALFAAMGSTVTNEQDVQQALMPVMLLLVASIVFIQPILLDPTSNLSKVMSWLPFSAPILMPLRMTIIQVSWGSSPARSWGSWPGARSRHWSHRAFTAWGCSCTASAPRSARWDGGCGARCDRCAEPATVVAGTEGCGSRAHDPCGA